MTERITPTKKRESLKHKRSYGEVQAKSIWKICLEEGRILSNKEIVEKLKGQGIYVDPKTVYRAKKRLKAGAQVDGLGTIQTLKDAIAKGQTIEPDILEKEIAKVERIGAYRARSEGYIKNIGRQARKVAEILGKDDPKTWTKDEVFDKVINPMIHDKSPFPENRGQYFEYSPKTINGLAIAVRKIAPQLARKGTEEELITNYNPHWTSAHGRRIWRPPLTWLTREQYKIFKEHLIKENNINLPQLGKWTLGELMALVMDTQIVTGMREKKETLEGFTWDRIILQGGDLADKVSYISGKRGEVWEDLPLHLFQNLCYNKLADWYDYQRTRKAITDPQRQRVFPISYEVYRKAIERARKKCLWENAKDITGHAFRRTHATWLQIGGATLDGIAGNAKQKKGWLGVGWATVDTLKNHYLGIVDEIVKKSQDDLTAFNPFGKLTEEQEFRAQIFETGKFKGEKSND